MEPLKRICIIDDHTIVIRLLILLIKESIKDSEIITETHGLRGFELIKSCNPDLIILDIILPGMSGFDICQELRKIDKFKEVPIIAFTSLSMISDKKIFVDAGFNDYLPKTLEINELIKIIKRHLFEF